MLSFIFILIKLNLKKFSSIYTVHIYNVFISFTESTTEVNTGLHRREILCALRLDAVILRTVELRYCPEELAGREVLINIAVPCILKVNWSPVITHQQCDNRQRLMYRWFSLAHLKNR